MADGDWKKRVGIEINFTSDSEDEGVNNLQEERKKTEDDEFPTQINSNEFSMEGNKFFDDHILNEYAEYGTTPPRTRISRRQKERKQRERSDTSDTKVSSTIKTKRRNTLDSIYFNEILERSEDGNISSQEYEQLNRVETTRRSKRSMKIIRGSERDMKHDHASARHSMPPTMEHVDDRAESMPIQTPQAIKIETCNRFLSLTSKLVACSKLMHKEDKPKIDYPQNRVEFYNTFSLLIRMGSSENKGDKNPRRQLSKEEHLWQNELKDIIWLELQAWHADRTSTEQDEYLCAARESVGTLLDNIMNYRFTRSPIQEFYPLHLGRVSTQSSDSGISVDGKLSAPSTPKITTCVGCLSIYCQICKENQNAALKDVEELLNRLEAAESLYPSSKAFGAHYPLYKSSLFVGRVKAMCLWYNMTKHHRLMMMILGKLLMLLQSKNSHWPQVGDDETSGIATDASVSEDQGISSSRRTSVEGKPFTKLQSRVVQFEMDSSSPSDSNNSNASSHGTGELSETISEVDYYNPANISKLQTVHCHSTKPSPISPYRKYIEDMLKTKGLRKSLSFLEKLHRYVLIKATATLRKPKGQDTLTEKCSSTLPDKNPDSVPSSKDLPNRTSFYSNSMDLAEDEEEELVRYGYWSCEAQDLHLPSYRSAFLFLSRIPLEVIHEFLRMRLEQKPEEPSVLCIRQLMRELKEGLRIAVLHKQRYLSLLHTTLWDVEKQTLESFEEGITEFDNSVKTVLELYLEYLQKWVPQVHQERFQKNILEEEWLFVKKTCPNIPGGEGLAANSFCRIASGMLEEIGRYLTTGVKELTKNLYNGDVSQEEFSIKQVVLSVCREFQFLYNEARERALKALAFAKTLRKDLECGTFVLKNHPSCSVIIAGSLQELKTEALALCHDITTTIRTLENTCNLHDLGDLDDCDKIQLLNRCREILHLGYKFGFEYHKEVCRLVTGDARAKLSRGLISFAQQWMKFVKERCERGRGLRPRWANQGLDFLMTVCEPENTHFLSNSEFEELKKSIDECISHVIGTAAPVHDKCVAGHSSLLNHTPRGSLDGQYPRSRGSSPVSRTKSPSYRSSRSMQDTSNSPGFPPAQRSISANVGCGSIDDGDIVDGAVAEVLIVPPKGASRIQRVFAAVRKLDNKLEEKLRNKELIGSVTDVECEDKIHIKSRSVTFSWQRGIKIGQGRFGKVYTAVNNQTGELMAMKEIQLQPNDHRTIRRVAEELKTFEGIHHQALVRYYGVEIHREEMLIFMEFCTEGTLESLVAATESGLPEVLIRRYTHQLLEAVLTLHNYGIVHRDIKSANIFLTDKGNSLKLGDFGSAVKIKSHTTMPGELQGFVGTQAYMAPEVFMNSEGHGRAADVWSLGCVVVEMASGERPWAEFDSNYQIMFKVGMGETPSVPDSLSDEGHQFADLCLQHDPKKRAAAQDLLHHTFVKVDIDDDHISSIPSILEESLKITRR